MEAVNRGCQEAGAACRSDSGSSCRSSRASIHWVDLGINFRYFFARKTMFVKYAQAFRDPARRVRHPG